MYSNSSRGLSKIQPKTQKTEAKRPLKPIFPKLPILSHPATINKRCFVCDLQIVGRGVLLIQNATTTTNTTLPTKIGQIIGDSFMVVVTHQDVVCRKCYALFNQADQLEAELVRIQRTIKSLLYKKYNITESLISEENPFMEVKEYTTSNFQFTDLKPEVTKTLGKKVPIVTKVQNPLFRSIPQAVENIVDHPTEEVHETPEKNVWHKCTMCDIMLDSPKLMRRHKMAVHLSSWTCHFCNALFENESTFTEHITSHLRDAAYTCQQCSKAYNTKEQLMDHLSAAHSTPDQETVKQEEEMETVHTCIICSLDFIQQDAYLEHLRTHEDLNVLDLENLGKADGDGLQLDVFEGTPEPTDLLDINMFNQANPPSDDAYVCTECNLQIGTLAEAKEHIQTVHSVLKDLSGSNEGNEDNQEFSSIIMNDGSEAAEDKFVCTVCGVMVEDIEALNIHLQDCREGATSLFTCLTCNAVAEKEEDLIAHSMICGKELEVKEEVTSDIEEQEPKEKKPKSIICSACGQVFESKAALYQHEKENPSHLIIECPDCDLKFPRERALNEHREKTHSTFHCRHCTKAFQNIKQAKAHETRHARAARTRFDCFECGRVFQTHTGIRNHLATHTGAFRFTCEFCGKGFVSRVGAEEHRACHTKEERYTCELCNLKFSVQATYWIHKKWHENPKPYKCTDCGRLFKHSSLLAVHRRKHTGERPYACQYCEQTFSVSNSLKRHLSLHTGIFPYTCTVCKTGFPAKHKLAAHMSKIHQDNVLLNQQLNKTKSNFKMLVKDPKTNLVEEATDETWILAEEQNEGGQYLTLETEDGERILLAEGILDDGNKQLVEVIYPGERIGGENEVAPT